MLSSCLGQPVLAFFNTLWESSVNNAHLTGGRSGRWRGERAESDMWEMEYRGRTG